MRITARPVPSALRPIALLLTAAVFAGCGDDGASPPSATTVTEREPKLGATELALIERTEREVGAYCRGVAAAVARGREPSARSFARVSERLEELGELAAAKPDAPTGGGSSPRLALGDIAEDLEGTNCDSRLVARIDAALAEIP